MCRAFNIFQIYQYFTIYNSPLKRSHPSYKTTFFDCRRGGLLRGGLATVVTHKQDVDAGFSIKGSTFTCLKWSLVPPDLKGVVVYFGFLPIKLATYS
jgi:hypothetical protein